LSRDKSRKGVPQKMPRPNPRNVEWEQRIENYLSRSKAAFLTDYRGLSVTQVTDLRQRLREVGAEYHVAKNTLLRIAARNLGISLSEDRLEGPTAVVFAFEDPISPAKVLTNFFSEVNLGVVKGGILEGREISPQEVQALTRIPPREVLLAQLVGGLQAPLVNLVGTLQGILLQLVYTLQAIAEKKAQSGSS
jgi:large subunit ribosomal protein L10